MNIPRTFFRGLSFLFFAAVLVFAGCKSSPPAMPPVHPAAALPPNMDAYFYLSMEENKDLIAGFIDQGMGGRYFLENTRVMYGSVKRDAPDGGLMIAAQGDYSVRLVEFGIGREDAWEETGVLIAEGEARYYRNRETGMEMAIPAPQLILTGSGIAERLAHLFAGRAAFPVREDTLAAWESHAAGFYLPRIDEKGLPPLIPPNLPIAAKEILILADPRGAGETDIAGSVSFDSADMALAASFFLRMSFAGFMGSQGMSAAEIRSTLKITPEGKRIDFSGIRFPRKAAEQLFAGLIAEGAP